jgi:plastocyanin
MTIVLAALMLAVGCGGKTPSGAQPAEPETTTPAAAPEPAPTPGAVGTATVSGAVRYEGEVPAMKTIQMDADPGCAKKHDSPVRSEMLVLGEGKTMANVLVRVKGGLAGGSYAPPSEPAVLDQDGCRYVPHVLGLMVGQPLKILNSDGLLHNVHAMPEVNKTFNMAMPASRTEASVTFTEVESSFKIKCDVHPWMGAYVAVLAHPFFDVTSDDGTFTIENLPAGRYEIEAWHEKLGVQTLTTEVADAQTVELEFTMTR